MGKREYQRTGVYEAVRALWDELRECEGGHGSVPPPPRPSEEMGIKESASAEAAKSIVKALEDCKERKRQRAIARASSPGITLKFTAIKRTPLHVEARVATRHRSMWATNGSVVFSVAEWYALIRGAAEIITEDNTGPVDREMEMKIGEGSR